MFRLRVHQWMSGKKWIAWDIQAARLSQVTQEAQNFALLHEDGNNKTRLEIEWPDGSESIDIDVDLRDKNLGWQ